MRGSLIVIEGADSSGKATQAALLAKRLAEEGHEVRTLDFPQYDSFFGKHVARFLRGEYGSLDQVHPELASMLFALDRFSQKEKLKGWLDEGAVVVLNRYMESNMAHQGAKLDGEERKRLVAWLRELEVGQLGLPPADLVIYLHVPTEQSQRIISGRGRKGYLAGKEKDIHESDRSYQERCVQTYLELHGANPHWRLVECAENGALLPREDIHSRVWDSVREHLAHRHRGD